MLQKTLRGLEEDPPHPSFPGKHHRARIPFIECEARPADVCSCSEVFYTTTQRAHGASNPGVQETSGMPVSVVPAVPAYWHRKAGPADVKQVSWHTMPEIRPPVRNDSALYNALEFGAASTQPYPGIREASESSQRIRHAKRAGRVQAAALKRFPERGHRRRSAGGEPPSRTLH